MTDQGESADVTAIRTLLEGWAGATRQDRQEDILTHHAPDVLIYDVLGPINYEGAAAYRQSWDEWQPDTQAEGQFDLEALSITAGTDVAFATSLIRCGGTLPDGHPFEDLVRATFCLQKQSGSWVVAHQHISKPISIEHG